MQLFLCMHVCSRIFNDKLTSTSIVNQLLIEYGSKTDERNTTKINSSATFVLSLLSSFIVVIIA